MCFESRISNNNMSLLSVLIGGVKRVVLIKMDLNLVAHIFYI